MSWCIVHPCTAFGPTLAPRLPCAAAGLTNGTNDLALDPKDLEDALSLPDSDGLVSLAAAGTAGAAGIAGTTSPHSAPPLPPPLLRLCGSSVQLGAGCRGGSGGGSAPLEATFRLVAPLAGCQAGSLGTEAEQGGKTAEGSSATSFARCSPAHTRQLLMQPQPASSLGGTGADAWSTLGRQLVSFESAAWPGHFLTADAASGSLQLQQARAAPGGAASQTFLLRPSHSVTTAGTAGSQPAFSLEPLSQPGSSLVADKQGSLRLLVGGAGRGGLAAAYIEWLCATSTSQQQAASQPCTCRQCAGLLCCSH